MQIDRLFKIIYILLDKKTVTARKLAEQFEVSTRTIYRDVEVLSSAEIPVFMSKGKGGGISLMEDFVLNKTVLTEKEKSDILSSLQTTEAINFNESSSAIEKLGSLFGEKNNNWIEVDFSSWYNSDVESKIFNDIKSAIISKREVSFIYSSGKGESTKRVVQPIRLCFKGVGRYLYAYCTLRKDFRFFKLSRIKDCFVTNKYFERIVTGPIFKMDNSFDEKYCTLKLKISKNMAYRVYDEFVKYEILSNGDFICEMIFPLGQWLFPYIASFGSSCEVLEPLEIRNSIKEEFENTISNYL